MPFTRGHLSLSFTSQTCNGHRAALSYNRKMLFKCHANTSQPGSIRVSPPHPQRAQFKTGNETEWVTCNSEIKCGPSVQRQFRCHVRVQYSANAGTGKKRLVVGRSTASSRSIPPKTVKYNARINRRSRRILVL